MTTKDQAIALVLEAEHRARSCGFLSGTTNWAGVIVNVLNAQPPAPDCRTCEHMWIDIELGNDESTSRCDSALCVNGDQYQPAPKLVLWRTE